MLHYRERRRLCIQATVTTVMYARRGKEDQCLVWTNRAFSPSPCSSPLLGSSPLHPAPSPSLSSPSSCSVASSVSYPRQRTTGGSPRSSKRKHPVHMERRLKRPLITSEEPQDRETDALWEASMEFLHKTNEEHEDDDDDKDDDDSGSFVSAALPPCFPAVATETLPLRYSPDSRDEVAAAMAMQSGESGLGSRETEAESNSTVESYFVLTLRALTDSVSVDALFLPSPPLLFHSNTWLPILSHGAFSSQTPPPSPADLIGMAGQLANRRLVCLLEACRLGGARTELVLSRAFPLRD